MNSLQESKMRMYLTVMDYLIAIDAIIKTLPNYAGFFTMLKNAIASIQNFAELQSFDKTGITANKLTLRKNLILLGLGTSRNITAYALFVNNQVLLNETRFTESDFKRFSDQKLRDNVQGLYNRAQSNLNALATYGVTAATQAELQTAINNFVTAMPKPRLGISEKKQSTKQLANYFDSANQALRNIDALIDMIRIKQPAVYSSYKSARKLILNGNTTLSVRGIVLDKDSGEPIPNASLLFTLESRSNGTKITSAKDAFTILKKTAEKGRFYIQSMPAGIYSVNIKKNGYAELTVMITVTDGELTEMKVLLSRI